MMKPQFKRVENYIKPGKWHWLKAVLWSVITLRFFIDLIRLLAYYSVNCIVGRQQATIGKNCKIHPTVMLRQSAITAPSITTIYSRPADKPERSHSATMF